MTINLNLESWILNKSGRYWHFGGRYSQGLQHSDNFRGGWILSGRMKQVTAINWQEDTIKTGLTVFSHDSSEAVIEPFARQFRADLEVGTPRNGDPLQKMHIFQASDEF